MENTKTFEEVKAASDSVFMAWKNAGEREACDFLNNSNRDMILAYTKRYPSAKAYKMWSGIVGIDVEICITSALTFFSTASRKA